MDKWQPKWGVVSKTELAAVCLLYIKPVWNPGAWLHFNTQAPCEYLALNTSGTEGKRKQRKYKGNRWSYLLFLCLRVPLGKRAAQQPFVNCGLSSRRKQESTFEWKKEQESGQKKKKAKRNRKRRGLAKAGGGRHLYARLNFGTLAFSD